MDRSDTLFPAASSGTADKPVLPGTIRVAAVRNYLIDSRRVHPDDTPEGKRQNRRTELVELT